MASLLDLFAPLEPEEDSEITTDVEESEQPITVEEAPTESERSEITIPETSVRGPVYSTPDHDDPGQAYIEISETEDIEPTDASEYNDNNTYSPPKRRKSLFTLFQHDISSESDDEEEQHRNPKYTFNNTVVGSYKDELAQEMKREVAERKILQKQKIEESARNNKQRGGYTQRRDIRSTAWLRRIFMKIQHKARQQHNILIFLAIMGTLTGAVGFAMDLLIKLLELGHITLTYTTNIWPVQFLLWTLYLYLILGVAVFSVRKISLCAMGSGIPEMKSILSGVTLVEYFSFRTLIAKIIGLSCAIGAGMVVGKEGPFVHTASIIANQLFNLPFFNRIRNSGPLRQQMFTCAIAAGVAGNFGAPIGGLLFSIEVTSTYYPVRNYFFSAWAAMFSGFTFRFLWNVRFQQPLFSAIAATAFTKESEGIIGLSDVLGSIVLGVIGGIIGILFIFLHLSIIRIRRNGAERYWIFKSPYPYTILIAGLTALLLFPEFIGNYMNLLPIAAFKALTITGPLEPDWRIISIWVSVPLFLLSRFWLTGLSISLPIPCGLFVPIITVGAGVGRLFGEVIGNLLGEDLEPTGDLPGIMAVVGAAAVGAGVTQTFSVAVIMFELTGQIILLVPVTITVIIAIATSRMFSYNVYDGILKSRNLPYLPDIRTRGHSMRAVDIMDSSVVSNNWFLTRKVSYKRLVTLMKETEFLSSVAVVDSEVYSLLLCTENPTFLGIVSRSTLEELKHNFQQETLGRMNDREECVSPSDQRTWHENVTKNLATVTKAFNPFNNNEYVRRDDQEFHSTNTMVDADFGQEDGPRELFAGSLTIPYEYSPVQLQPSTPLTSIHLLFITLRLRNAYVTINGRLVGVITRATIKQIIDDDSIFEWLAK